EAAVSCPVFESLHVPNEEVVVRGSAVGPPIGRERLIGQGIVERDRRPERSVDDVIDEVTGFSPDARGSEPQRARQLRLVGDVELVGARVLDVVADAVDDTWQEHERRVKGAVRIDRRVDSVLNPRCRLSVKGARGALEIPAVERPDSALPLAGRIVSDADARTPGEVRLVDRLLQNRTIATQVVQPEADVQGHPSLVPLVLRVRRKPSIVTLHVVPIANPVLRYATVRV